MKVVFLGTPALAIPALDRLLASEHDVVAVLTRPDRPAGRHRAPNPPPVKSHALERGIPVWQPDKAREAVDDIEVAGADVLAVVAYGGWLPPPVLDVAPHGCVNVHPSLLPRWRGAAPIERAIMAGDPVTGVTTMQIDEGLDTGPLYLNEVVEIAAEETAGELALRLAEVGAGLLVRTLDGVAAGELAPSPQSEVGVTYAEKLTPDECEVDWAVPALTVDGLVRGANPRPGAWTVFAGRRVKLWRTRLSGCEGDSGGHLPGTVIGTSPLQVACGSGCVEIVELQPEGRRAMLAADFCLGHDLRGARFGRHGDT
ncbi:MAG: methionyl-tRNA formyltransferase [Acidimicrobiia bacterium]|nr:methionyl-tRNA formyltransferase [Acidimicrobiia bacterium]